MGQDTNIPDTNIPDANILDTKCAYRIVDASFRVHTRLYKLHYSLIHTENTIFTLLKNNIIASGAVVISAILGLVLLYVQIAQITLSSASLLTLVGLISALALVYGYQYKQAKKAEDDLKKISSEIKLDSLEKWPDYLWDEAAKWGTRILMAKEVLEENEKIYPDKKVESYKLNKRNFVNVIEDSLERLKKYKELCEKSNLIEVSNECERFIKLGEIEYAKWNK